MNLYVRVYVIFFFDNSVFIIIYFDYIDFYVVYLWDYWFYDDGRFKCGYVGLINLGVICYMVICM